MAGSIRPRPEIGPNVFELRVFVGRDFNGRVRHRSRTFRGTHRQAERELARLLIAQEDEPSVVPDEEARSWGASTTVNDAIEGWKRNGWEDLSPVTARRYDSVWKVHIRDSIGRRKIASLSPYDVERFFRQLKSSGSGRETIRYVRSVLHRACRLARKWSSNTLPNPITDTDLPTFDLTSAPAPVRAPTAGEVRSVLQVAAEQDPRYGACLRFIAATGVRRGEAAALRWSDIDWANEVVTIDEAIVTADGGAQVKSPKTRASIRQLAIDSGTIEALRRLCTEQEALAFACGAEVTREGFVFSAEPGGATPPYPDTVSRAFTKARVAAGVASDIHLHSLRHFQATTLDVVIPERQKQARLGWSTVHMARHYTDTVASEDRRAADHVGALLDASEE